MASSPGDALFILGEWSGANRGLGRAFVLRYETAAPTRKHDRIHSCGYSLFVYQLEYLTHPSHALDMRFNFKTLVLASGLTSGLLVGCGDEPGSAINVPGSSSDDPSAPTDDDSDEPGSTEIIDGELLVSELTVDQQSAFCRELLDTNLSYTTEALEGQCGYVLWTQRNAVDTCEVDLSLCRQEPRIPADIVDELYRDCLERPKQAFPETCEASLEAIRSCRAEYSTDNLAFFERFEVGCAEIPAANPDEAQPPGFSEACASINAACDIRLELITN